MALQLVGARCTNGALTPCCTSGRAYRTQLGRPSLGGRPCNTTYVPGVPRRARGLRLKLAASSEGGGAGEPQLPVLDKRKLQLRMQFELLGQLLVRYPALIGSLAVTAGYFLKIDALGNLHWNAHDALLGLQCALPIMALDALLMLPDYSPGTTTKVVKLKAPRAVAEMLKRQEEAKQGKQQQQQQQAEAPAALAAEQQQAEQQQQGEKDATPVSATAASTQREPAQQAAEQRTQQEEGEGAAAQPVLNAVIVVDETGPTSVVLEQAEDLTAAETNGAAAPAAAAMGTEGAAAAGAAAADEDMVEIEKTISVRAEQHPVLAALYRAQMEKATDNVGRLLPFPLELVLLLTWHLAEEMLYRAVVLTWAVGWTIDRLYEAGADETVGLLGWQLATPQAGAVLAAVGCTTVSLALLVQRALFPARLIAQAEEELAASEAKEAAREEARSRIAGLGGSSLPPQPGKAGSPEAKLKERQRMRKVLEKVKTGLVRQRKWSTAIEGSRDVVEWAAYSTSFLLTGNLLAPYATAVSADLLFSGYQRFKQRQVDAAQEQSMKTIKELHQTAMAISKARKSVLEPPSDSQSGPGQQGSGSENSSNGISSTGSSSTGSSKGSSPDAAAEEPPKEPASPSNSSTKSEE